MNINSSLQKTPIAVIGLSAIVADARNIEEFWMNIIQGKDSITDVPENRWRIEDYYDADMTAPDKTYCKRGGFLPDIDFNPMEFGLPPNILEVTDASQLLGLVAARDALEDAGYGKDSIKFTKALKEKTGVLLGVGGGQKLITPLISRLQYPIWEKALRESGIAEEDIPHIVDKMKKAYVGWNENSFPGLLGNVISGRITNRFDLGGINSVVDAACAASLSAIKMSLSELVEGRCDMMLTGGVDTDNSPFMYMSFSKTPAFSMSGNISPFSEKADGMLIGEGLGMLVLKRLEDAERDGDRIYAVIKGVGTSSDGRFKSVYAPRPSGQALAMNRAYEDAGFAPSTVGLIEGHGTGTGAGDPAEFTSMQMVFGKDNPKKQNIAIGSVKSQIGHTKAAAGAAGMVKAVLGLHHKVLPPTINVEQPNSKFDIKNSAFYINTEARPWLKNGHPRRAGVSAFGFGGINVHVVLEEYEGNKPRDYRLHQPYKSVLLEAENPTQLLQRCQTELNNLQGSDGNAAFKNLVNASKNSIPHQTFARIGFVVTDVDECIEFLQIAIQNLQSNSNEWSHPKGIHFRPNGIDTTSQELVALFAGQGSQYVGMGKELANAFPEVSEAFQKTDTLFEQNGERPLSKTIFPIPAFSSEEKAIQQKALTRTKAAQPAIGALSMGQYKILQKSGFQPHFTAGHSFGELTALWAGGVYDDDTFLALAKTRGAVMSTENPNADRGTMLAVEASQEQVQQTIANMPGVSIANVNSNNQIILGGSTRAINAAEQQLKSQGFNVISLPVSAAFHTEFVKHAQQPFSNFIERQKFNRPLIPVYSNTTGNPFPDDSNALKIILEEQILKPVLFKNQIENIYKAGGRVFVEFGPKGVLTKLVGNILKDKDHIAIAINPNAKKDSDLQFRQAVLQLRVLGLQLSNIDPYKKEMPALPAATKMNVKVSGNNYVSEPTKKAYQDVLNDGFKISGGQTQVIEKIVEVEKIVEIPAGNAINTQTEKEEEIMNKEVFQLLQATLESFKTNQTKSLEIFERFISDQNQQANQLLNMLSQQIDSEKELPSISDTIATPKVETVSESQVFTNTNSEPAVSKPAPVAETAKVETVAAQPTQEVSTGIDTSQLEKMLMDVVSEKTGYPAEMLELNMDMEADLGIDSIKRVEIFGALTKQYPEMAGINPNELTELRTLGEIVSYVAPKGAADIANQTVTTPAPIVAEVAPVQEEVKTVPQPKQEVSTDIDTSQLEKMLMDVVSEKTGYPAEMLELNMDMEADLGIDSIKRVEIFGALTKQYPEMAGINPNELTELRTLGEIVSYVAPKGAVEVANQTVVPPAPVVAESAPVQEEVRTESQPTQEASTDIDTSQLEKMLMDVVSEKTGYPAEMLELNMDMEADLGIDSIKRVEIFGALTKQYPEMAGINPNELTELRTLGEIVSYVAPKGAADIANQTVVPPAPVVAETAPVQEEVKTAPQPEQVIIAKEEVSVNGDIDNSQLQKMLLEVVSEKTGYPAEMLELNMDMEADLGIDSIKRVEIFGALTKQYPEMSDINPNELTELRTLGEIVNYVSEASKKKSSRLATSPVQTEEQIIEKDQVTTGKFHGVARNEIGLKYLPQPDFLEFSLPQTHVTLLTNDGSALTKKVVERLKAKGDKVVVLNLPGTKSPADVNSVTLTENSDQAVQKAIEEVHSSYGKIGSFIHLHPHFEFQNGNFTQHFKAEKEVVKTVFFLAKHLQKDLNDLGVDQRANFVTVTRMDGMLGQGKRGNVSVVGGGITGLVKSLNLEWSPVFCRAVDIQSELPVEKIADQVIAELHDANMKIVEVAFSEEGRKTTSVTPVKVDENQAIKTNVSKDSVFLVSGGARGVTANCVIEMAKAFQCKFILLGRSEFNFEVPEFAKNGIDDGALKRNIMNDLKEKGEKPSLPVVQQTFGNIVAKKEIDDTIAQIKSAGGQVEYLQGDVTNLAAIKPELDEITAKIGNITGIIHGAGRLADKYIQDKTEADFENVLSVKLDGLLSLLGVVDLNKLEHLILFSSVAGFYGNLGQTDYAIANEILSKAARLFKTNHPNTHVSAINWGAWDSGMVSGELKAQFEAAGVSLVNSEGGAAMLVNEFNTEYADQPQVIIGGTLPAAISHIGELQTYRIKRNLKLKDNPFLMHHVIQGNAVLPVVNAVGWMSQTCERLYPDFKVFKIENTKLFKGIVFDGNQKEDYVIELKELEKSAEQIVFETTVLSEGEKLPTYHYKATVTLMNKKSIPEAPKFSHPISGKYKASDGAVLYKDGSLFHDKYFQGIEQILDFTENQIVLSCKAPEVPLSEQGQFAVQSVNTFFADIQYQGMVVWVQKFLDGAMSLPLQTDSAIIYKDVLFGKELLVNVTIREASEFKMVADCTVYDSEGTVYMQTNGAAVTVSKQLVW